ncbi:MAG: RagB/SusD family nutrient uptake outer membrane protein [Gemmatimonadota bacterium]|nr:RagB/SusD family nutrient uptake outer membrane protein [Gemmatimonadota bacterium]
MNAIHRHLGVGAVLLAVAWSTGCTEELTVPNFNNPAREDLTGTPTRGTLAAAVQGLVAAQRGLKEGMVGRLGVWGREGYDLRPEEPRTTTDALIDPIDPINGGLFFGGQYTQIAGINTVLTAVENASVLTDTEKNAIRGFVKTLKADAYWQMIIARPIGMGIPLDPNPDPNAELTPISSAAEVHQYINSLYDEALSDLQSGGSSFPFQLPSGFDGYADPGSFAQVNRALKARALKYQGQWNDVLTTLGQSFIDASGDMDEGVYFNHSTISGDAPNGFFSTVSHFAHPRVRANAQQQPSGDLDQRVLDKTKVIPAFTLYEITVTEDMDVYQSLTAAFPWITNDELLLIRAEANAALGNDGAALADVNAVREESGGLAPLASFSGDPLDEILYNKLLSLLWEGGFAYLDMRQYDRLDELPRARPNHGVYPGFPYPQNECLARDISGQPECGTFFAQ